MQIGKMAKKIAAISTGALMLGATLTGALAASKLADYPAPFLKSGVLDNTVFVVGKTAATSDVLGAIDLAAALQAEALSKVAVEVAGSVAPTIDDGVKIEKSGDHFIYGADIEDIQDELDENDLPDMLEEGTFVDNKGNNKGDETYKQMLSFADGAFVLDLEQPEDMKGGVYLSLPDNNDVYTYTLDFDSPVQFDPAEASEDLEGTQLKIQGNTYTLTEVSVDSTDHIDKIKFLAGDSTVWLVQDQPYTVGDHTVTVVNVDENGDSCGVNVDGTTLWIDNGATEEVGGMSVGVLDVKVVHSKDYDQDTCELSLGSSELVLEDGEPIEVNGEELTGSLVDLYGDTAEYWDGFDIMYEAGKEDEGVNSDDVWLSEGQAWTDPVFGNFKVVYAGQTADYEEMKFVSTGEDAKFTFMNNDGKEVEIPFHYDSSVFLGTDLDEQLLEPGDSVSGTDYAVGTMLLYTTAGGEVHILEISKLTCGGSENKTTIKDLTYGTTVASDEILAQDCQNRRETISLGSLGDVILNITEDYVLFNTDAGYGDGTPESKYEGTFAFSDTEVTFTEKDGDETAAEDVTFNLTYDTDDDEINVNMEVPTVNVNNDEGDDDTKWGVTAKGTMLKYDNEDKLWLEFSHPEEDVVGNVFVAPLRGEVTAGGTGEVSADKVNPFAVGLAVLDEEAAGMTKNMIVVGGPCVNTVAAEVMGNPTNCAEGFEAGKAMLKFYDRKGKGALLVAGYDAQDTLNAAYVLAQHAKKYSSEFKTLNDEVELVVTDMSKVVFSTA